MSATLTEVRTIRVEIRSLDSDGHGVAEPLAWANADALKRPRIRFTVDREARESLVTKFIEGQRAPTFDLPVSTVTGFEMPPVGSLGWTAGRG